MNPYKEYDSGNMYQALIGFPEQIKHAWESKVELDKHNFNDIKNIVVSGLGGSAISGDIAQAFLKDQLNIPVTVNRSYDLPNFTNNETLLIACSYSGNTEETISVLKQGISRNVKIVCVTSNGEIQNLAQRNNIRYINVPQGFQPRCAFGLMFFSLIKILNEIEIVNIHDDLINEIYVSIKDLSKLYSMEETTPYNIAANMVGYFPVIHSTELLQGVNIRFRCQLAENSKVLAYSGIIPELNHNEIIGWEKFNPSEFPAILIQLVDSDDHPRNQLRFSITEEIIRKLGVEVIKIQSNENTFQKRLIDLIYMTDWISYYLAVLRGIDPTPIKNINYLKEKLAKL